VAEARLAPSRPRPVTEMDTARAAGLARPADSDALTARVPAGRPATRGDIGAGTLPSIRPDMARAGIQRRTSGLVGLPQEDARAITSPMAQTVRRDTGRTVSPVRGCGATRIRTRARQGGAGLPAGGCPPIPRGRRSPVLAGTGPIRGTAVTSAGCLPGRPGTGRTDRRGRMTTTLATAMPPRTNGAGMTTAATALAVARLAISATATTAMMAVSPTREIVSVVPPRNPRAGSARRLPCHPVRPRATPSRPNLQLTAPPPRRLRRPAAPMASTHSQARRRCRPDLSSQGRIGRQTPRRRPGMASRRAHPAGMPWPQPKACPRPRAPTGTQHAARRRRPASQGRASGRAPAQRRRPAPNVRPTVPRAMSGGRDRPEPRRRRAPPA